MILEVCKDCMEESDCYNFSCDIINKALNELSEYKNLEKQGLLIKLPCSYNDTLYWIAKGYVKEVCFKGIRCDKGYKPQIICRYIDTNLNAKESAITTVDNIGITLFLTKEEAENKLR